jgi:hypothetical protein
MLQTALQSAHQTAIALQADAKQQIQKLNGEMSIIYNLTHIVYHAPSEEAQRTPIEENADNPTVVLCNIE